MPAKGQRLRTHCKTEGCGEPVHVYPGGQKASFCAAHIKERDGLRLKGLPRLTGAMQRVMETLLAAHDAGYPFAAISMAWHTRYTLTVKRDWIVMSEGKDGVRYAITSRGIAAMRQYAARQQERSKKLCPRCGVRRRALTNGGRWQSYCGVCRNDISAQRYQARKRKRLLRVRVSALGAA